MRNSCSQIQEHKTKCLDEHLAVHFKSFQHWMKLARLTEPVLRVFKYGFGYCSEWMDLVYAWFFSSARPVAFERLQPRIIAEGRKPPTACAASFETGAHVAADHRRREIDSLEANHLVAASGIQTLRKMPLLKSHRANANIEAKATAAPSQPPEGSGLTTSRSATVRNNPIPPSR